MANPENNSSRSCVIGESDLFIARLLQRFAENSGLQVHLARTGEEVVELVQRVLPVLVVLEPELPGKVRGWEAARTLAQSRQSQSIPVMVCSWQKKADVALLIGQVSAYLQKPDLRYEDFIVALEAAGVKTGSGPSGSNFTHEGKDFILK